ncbi:MAG: PIG-L family deacetylase [Alphaproteobacteria bacterium]|nr:PIG-L family deacetylase [Alphaproteobacteria bacterium]MDX5416070.1 PIG-L family deacetylase [Alphaproteobacteria bacterium]MDX5493367.1 PIG-L family deacetylase [Alphaproteobacteria bacterium]
MLWVFAVIAVLALAGIAGWYRMSRYFEDEAARPVPSIAGAVGAKRILAIFAHPDDEQLINGLLISAKAEGAFLAMVTATKGDAGTQSPVVCRQSELGVIRHAEVLKNGFALGIDEQEVWDYPDGKVPDQPLEELVARVEAAIRHYRPDLVVAFWPESGATGHKDHMRMGLVAARAIERVRAGEGEYPGPRFVAYPLIPRKSLTGLGGRTGRFVADNQPLPTHSTPGNVASKVKGWKIHAAQADYVARAYRMPTRLLYLIWRKEFYALRDLETGQWTS